MGVIWGFAAETTGASLDHLPLETARLNGMPRVVSRQEGITEVDPVGGMT
jgi:hypothetical protein